MITINNEQELKKYFNEENNRYEFKESVNFNFSVDLKFGIRSDGDIRSGRDIWSDGDIWSGRDIGSGGDIRSDGDIWSGRDIRSGGDIRSDGDIRSGGYIWSITFTIEFQTKIVSQRIPDLRNYFSEMPPLKKWRKEILNKSYCYDDFRKMITKKEAIEICKWDGWHWIIRVQLEMFFRLRKEYTIEEHKKLHEE